MRTLQSDACLLEPQVEAHAPEMFSVLSDPAIYEFERHPPPSVERLAAGYRRLESRASPDGSEQWLNWVVRLPTGEATGYVQATILPTGESLVAYEFASRFWRRGLATAALRLMLAELGATYGVTRLVAVLKRQNFRSDGLLAKLGFTEMPAGHAARFGPERDEKVMTLDVAPPPLQPLTSPR